MGRSPQFYATVGVAILVLLAIGIVGFAYWSDYRADQQRPGSTAVQVGDTKYTLRYFAERLKTFVQQAGGPANQSAQPQSAIPAVADQLVQEEIVVRFASEKEVSADASDLRNEIATRLGLTPDDDSYDTRYQEELTRSGLTEDEYQKMIQAAVLISKMRTKFAADAPAAAESIHYRQIALSDQAEADEIKQQLEQGADFAQLASERSLDSTAKDSGGDVGWVPRGLLNKDMEDALFALEPQKLITFPSGSQVVFVFQMLEKAASRDIDADQRTQLGDKLLRDWLDEKKGQLEVKDFVSQDNDKAQWAIDRAYQVT